MASKEIVCFFPVPGLLMHVGLIIDLLLLAIALRVVRDYISFSSVLNELNASSQ